MKKTDMLLWIEALDDCLEGFEARLGAYEQRLAAVEAQKPAPVGGMTLTAEQVMVLRDLRDRVNGSPFTYLHIFSEVLEVLNDILKA